jgi:hypothetical protein
MKPLALYISGPLVVALLAPLALGVTSPQIYLPIAVGAMVVVFMFSLVVAAPLFLIVARLFQVRLLTFIGLSFVAGFVSFLTFALMSEPTGFGVGDVVLVHEGQLTPAGWENALMQSARIGLASIPGGVLWWLAARVPLEEPLHGA